MALNAGLSTAGSNTISSTINTSGGTVALTGASTLGGTIKNSTLTSAATLTSNSGWLDGVTIGSNLNQSGTLLINNGITLANGVTVNKGSSAWYFGTTGTQHIATTGTAILNSAGGAIYAGYAVSGQTLQIDSGIKLQGYGTLGQYYSGSTINNAGTIIANTAGQTFTVGPSIFNNTGTLSSTAGTLNLASAMMTSSGTITSSAGGSINLSGTLDNTGRTLDIGSGGFGAGALTVSGTIKGGTLVSNDGRTLTSSSGTLDGVTIGSNLTESGSLFITNGITLGDGVTVNLGNSIWYIGTTGTQHIATPGTATLNTAGGNIYAGYSVSGQTLQIDSGITLQGYGVLNNSGAVTIINAGTIISNTAGQTFTINPSVFTNSGTLSSTAGTLNLAGAMMTSLGTITSTGGSINLSGTLDNTGRTLDIGSGGFGTGALTLSGGIIGGTLVSNDGRALISTSGWLDGVTIGSNLTESGWLNINNGITLANGVTVNLGNSSWAFRTTSMQHIATPGTATINTVGGTIYAGYGISDQTLQIDSGITLKGYGTLAQSSAATINNAGTIISNTAGQMFSISPAAFNNTGTLNAIAGGLSLSSAMTTAQLGSITSSAGGSINLSGTLDNTGRTLDIGSGGFGAGSLTLSGTIKGGTLVSNDGRALISNSATLDGVTLGSNLTESGSVWINNGITLANGVTVNLGDSTWYFRTSGLQHIATPGTATINNAWGSITAGYGVSDQTLQIDSGITLQGYGTLAQSSAAPIINAGIINANTAGQTFSINPSSFTNSGTMNANGGTLNIVAANWSNPGKITTSFGTLNLGGAFTVTDITGSTHYSRTGGTVNLTGTLDNTASTLDVGGTGVFGTGGLNSFSGTIKNGTLVNTDTHTLTSSSGTLDGVTLGSNLTESGSLYINNGITLANGVTVDKGSSYWYFNTTGLQHIATPGTATINSAGGVIYAGYGVNGQTLQIDSGITLQGYGGLYNYYATPIINAGTINANTAGQTFTLSATTFTNSGSINAAAGNLSFGGTTFINNAGHSVIVGATSNLDITSTTFANDGTLTLGGTTQTIRPTNWTNAGSIALNSGTLNLGGTINTSLLDPLHYTRAVGTVVNLTGTLDNTASTLDIGSAGVFGTGGLNSFSGTIKNGTLVNTDTHTLTSSSGTLDGVTLGSNLTESGSLYINNGITLANGVTVNLGNSAWYFNTTGTQHIATPGTATINSAGGGIYAGYYVSGQTLQIDSGITLQGYGGLYNYYATSVINVGTINANTAGQSFSINSTNFTNNAALNVTAGALNIGGTTHTIGTTNTNWTNAGSIALNNGTLNLGGTVNTAQLDPLHYTRAVDTTVNLTGTLDNTASTLDIGGTGVFGTGGLNTFSGTIKNGTLVNTDTHILTSNSGTLDGVTLGSNLTESGSLYINNGITLANGVTVNLGNSSSWLFNTTGTQHIATLGTATINSAGGTIYTGYYVSGQTLQIDSGITLQGYGGLYNYYATPVINAGIINANTTGQGFYFQPSTFTNSGTINVAAGATFYRGASFTSTGILTGSGAIILGAGNTLTNTGTIAPGIATADTTGTLTINGNLVMGAGSQLNMDMNSPLAGDYDKLSVSGTANLTNGTLNLAGGGSAGSYPLVSAAGGLGGTSFATINAGTFTHTPTYAASILTLGVTANSNAAIYWDGGASTTNWADALNWSNDLAPTSATNLYIGSGAGTVFVTTVGQAANALVCDGNFTLSAGSLNLASASIFRGTTTISGGTLTGAGAITIASGGVLNWTAGTIDATTASTLTTQTGSTTNFTAGTLGVNRAWNSGGVLNLVGALSPAAIPTFTRTAGSNVNLTGALDLGGGTLDIGSTGLFGTGGLNSFSGTIKNGTLINTDATQTLTSNSGTLDGVTLGGTTLTEDGSLWILNGLTLANGVTVNKGASNWYFNTTGTQHIATPGTATINSAGGAIYSGYLVSGQTLQIDSGITLQGFGGLYNSSAASIINAGTITANTAGQTFTISPSTFTNSGTLNAVAGTMTVSSSTFTNSGTTNVSGGTLNITPTNWSNPGKINVNNGVLNLNSPFTLADLTGSAHYSRTGGSVNLNTVWDLAGGTLDIGSAGLFGAGGLSSFSNTIKNGTVMSSDATSLNTSGGTLDGVTLGGTTLTEDGSFWILNGLTLANGVTVNKGASNWFFNTTGTQHIATPGTATINSAGGAISANYYASNQTLQIDSGITLQGYGTLTNYGAGTTIINAGTINANTPGQIFYVNPGTFTNSGTMNANGGTLSLTATNWTNPGKINVNTGILNLGGAFTTAQVTGSTHYSRTGGSVNLTGTLDNTGSTLDIAQFGPDGLTSISGTIKHGTVMSSDATSLNASGGTLDGVTLGGSTLTETGSVWILNGLTLANGVTVNKGADNWYFNTTGTQHIATPGTATINSAGGAIYASYYGSNQSLQIDSGITLQGYGTLSNYGTASTIINDGTINANRAGQTFTINPTTFTNSGTMNVSGGTLDITSTNWTNPGKINVNTGILNLGGAFTTAQVTGSTHYSRTGGSVNLTGTLDNTGSTLDIVQFGPGGLTSVSGTIKHGTVMSSDATSLNLSSGTLDGVTLGGSTLNETGTVYINNGLTLADGVTVNKEASAWYFGTAGTQHIATPGSATINSAGGYIEAGYGVNGQTLQIDSGITLQGYGGLYNYYTGSTIINAGTINANTAGQTFTISPTTFINSGTMNANGGTLSLTATNWTNPGKINVNTGILNLGGAFTTAQVTGATHYSRTGGNVNLTGTLDNTGSTLDVAQLGPGGLTTMSGTIKHGTVMSSDATPLNINGTLDGVTLGGATLATNGNFTISNGLTLANGVTVNKGAGTWYFSTAGTQHIATSGAATLNNAGGGIYAGFGAPGQILQIDNGVTLQGYGTLSEYYTAYIINAGTINANTPGQTFTINPTTFTNNGTVLATAGTAIIGPSGSTWTNAGLIDVSAGATFSTSSRDLVNNGTMRGSGTVDVGYAQNYVCSPSCDYVYTLKTLTNNGTIAPGVGAGGTGTLTLMGDLVQGSTSKLHLDLGGTGVGQFDRLSVVGISQKSATAQLGGTLEFAEGVNGFYADLGNAFSNLVTSNGSLSGNFATVSVPTDVGFALNQAGSVGITNTNVSRSRWGTDASGDWGIAGNWTRSVPTANKDAIVSRASATPTVTVSSGSRTAHSLQFDENLQITGGNLILPTGFTSFSGNVALAGGTLTLPASFIGFGGVFDLAGGTLVNPVNLSFASTQNWTSGTVTGAGSISVASTGVINKSGAGLVDIQQVFNNAGQVNETGGVLNLNGGGTQSGSFDISGGSVLNLSGGQSLNGASFTSSGAGSVNVSGPLSVNSTVGIGSGVDFTLPVNGTLSGGGTLQNQGTLHATGVTMPAALVNSGTAYLDGTTISGNVTNTGSLGLTGNVVLSGSSAILSSGTVNLNSGASLTKSGGSLN